MTTRSDIPAAVRRISTLAVLLLGCTEGTPQVDVKQAERAVDDAQKQVEHGLRETRERVVEVGEDLGKAAEQVQTKVGEVAADTIPVADGEAAADILRDASSAISCTEEACTIEKAMADRMRAQPTMFATQAKVDPERRDGRAVGLMLSEVQELPRLLGFRDRDVIVSINGLPVQSMQSVPQIVLQLRSATRFTVVYERAGVRATKVIDIV